MEIKLD